MQTIFVTEFINEMLTGHNYFIFNAFGHKKCDYHVKDFKLQSPVFLK